LLVPLGQDGEDAENKFERAAALSLSTRHVRRLPRLP
jgi:hypothetical protein